jgi:TatA/E family protein of Tat protein translocase
MFGLGTQEIILILVIALILFGPKKLPEIGRAIGQGLRELKKASNDVMNTLDTDYDEPEPEPARQTEPAPEQKKETLDHAADSYRN